MQDNVYERIHRVLSWKRIIAFNFFLFLVLVVPLSVRLAQIDTENRSNASEENIPVVTPPPPSYPTENPTIERVKEFFGKKGDAVVLIGNNFGNYKWESRLYVGSVEVNSDDVVRWSNSIIEVIIPENARAGKVSIIVNGKRADWEGNLLLSDMGNTIQMGIGKESGGEATLWVSNAGGMKKGMVELGTGEESTTASLLMDGSITNQTKGADSLGNKLKIEFTLNNSLTSNMTKFMRINYPTAGSLEIIRAELYDESGKLMSIEVDPMNIKTN